MDFEALMALYRNDKRVQDLKEIIAQPTTERVFLDGIVGSLSTVIAAALYQEHAGPTVFILNDKEEAAYFQNDLKNLLPKKDSLFFPDSFKKPGMLDEVNKSNILLRTETVSKLQRSHTSGEIIVTYPEALLEKVVDTRILADHILNIKINEKLDIDFTRELLIEYGFDATDFVYEPGQFSVRGGIMDIYSFGNDLPYRVEFFDDEVESIRIFDPLSQLSDKKVTRITIIPNIQTQFSSSEKTSIFKLLPIHTLIWSNCVEKIQLVNDKIYKKCALLVENGNFDDHHDEIWKDGISSFMTGASILVELDEFTSIEFDDSNYFKGQVIPFRALPQPVFNKNFNLLIDNLHKNTKAGFKNIIFADNARQIRRFESIFSDLDADVAYSTYPKSLFHGFIDQDLQLAIYTDHQIFDRYLKYNIKQAFSRQKAMTIRLLKELKPGDYVTHLDHGIGKYSGLEKIEINGKVQETVRIIYRDNDLLYVNVNSLHKISKYASAESKPPKISKLGSDTWQNLKRKTKKKIKDIADELIQLYAKRKTAKGFAFRPDTYLQTELEASFIYEDTPDQEKATQDFKADMEADFPMDRLICGDVGFGKTEIAIRAATKAVADGKQVAILVPTTILAVQHYKTFLERLGDFPAKVDYINRFKTAKQKRETIEDVAAGKIDILIGTHAILSNKIIYKDLGLLIIDEEQKFGVAAKEKLKNIKVNVDTLTLTATPIPRTLQFSLMSARDLSVMRTPPPNRQPVTTELIEMVDEKIRDAINFEVYRGGQVFFVHNRVKDLADIAAYIQRLCPDADVGTAHGQLDGKTLEDRMMKFINRTYDVLVSTNIVEAGLDIPNANTIFIHNAHQFGLSDLHQLRGRVGRSNKKAFCYLIAPSIFGLPSDSRTRLKTIEQFSDLGSGFNIAMKDLDIRGAGNLLGGEQSGFISDIGFDTYQKILDEAIHELRENRYKEVFEDQIHKERDYVRDVQIDTDVEMLIPDDYVNKIDERLLLYREMNELNNEDELQTFKKNLIDRFGPLPLEVNHLFQATRIGWTAKQLGFERLILKNNKLRCYFISNQESPFYNSPIFSSLISYVAQKRHGLFKESNGKFILIFENVNEIDSAKEIMADLVAGIKTQLPTS